MRKIVNIKFGSHLYGTSTPQSDVDYKSVFIPDARDIVLQRVKGSISTKREKADGEKNYAGEIDEESYSLQRYLQLVAEGQTVALDILFSTRSSMTKEPHAEWDEIVANRHRLITKKAAAFIGYCRTQANKYGIKGSRVAAARSALATLEEMLKQTPHAKLGDYASSVLAAVAKQEHMSIVAIPQAGGTVIEYWEVCNRKLSFNATVRHARDVVQALVNEYGKRALQAESNEGVDWKALSHAVRVGNEAIELLQSGWITFPLPNFDHVLDIKLGKLPYKEVSAEIEDLLVAVEAEAAKSSLPDEPDLKWIDDFVCRVYGDEVFHNTR